MNKKIIIFIIFSMLLSVLVFIIFTSENNVAYTDKEREWISKNKDKIFFMGYYNSPGEVLFVKKLCEILSKETGLKIVPYDDTWDNTMRLLKSGKLPMSSTMDMTPQRLKYINYTAPFKGLSAGIYSRLSRPIDQYEEIKGKNIGVIRSVKLLAMFEERYRGISFNTILYDDIESMIEGLRRGEIDGFISTKNYDESTRDFYYFNITTISKDNNHIGIHKDYPELYSIISKEVNYLIDIGWSSAVKEAINFELEKQHLAFDDVEITYLDTDPVVTIGIIEGCIFSGYKKDYLLDGIIPNVFDKIAFLTNIEFEYVFDSYDNLHKDQRIDLIATVGHHCKDCIYTNPMFSHTVSVLGREDVPFIKEVYDLEPYSVGVIANGPESDYIIQQMPQIDVQKYDDHIQLLGSVEEYQSEYVLLPNVVADAYIPQFQGLTYKGILYERFHYMMAKNTSNPALISVINKCLAVIDMESIVHEEVDGLVDDKTDDKIELIIAIGAIAVLVGIIINLLMKKRTSELKLMYTDKETCVNNRLWLEKKLKKDINKYTFFSVQLKDLFILKERYGQVIYEKALRTAIKAIEYNLQKRDLFAIIDKEKFVIAKVDTINTDAEGFARDLEKIFGEKILIYDMSYNFSGIVGWTTIEDDINNFNEVIECLNIAAYFSEKEGLPIRYSYGIFSKYKAKFDFDKQFVSAVMYEKLTVLFRYVYDKYGEVFALDTSVTCHLKDYGHLNSKSFYEATKRLGLAGQVDVIVLKNIIEQIKSWEKKGEKVCVMVSLSYETISNDNFMLWIIDVMDDLENMQLMIKLDGKILENNIEQLLFLEHENIGFIVKNFGSDVLNMVETRDFPTDIVCIDNDFILNIGEDKLYDEALDYVVSVAKKMDKKIMVKDVVSKNQYDVIITRDIDYISGNYIKSYVRGDEVFYEDTNY